MKHRTVTGRISYRRSDGWLRGHETFHLTVHSGGDRTIRSVSEIYDSGILRDVTYTVDRNWRPRDAAIRLRIHDEFVGSSWFRFDGQRAECEAYLADGGRVSQRISLDVPVATFNPHPVQVDMWHFGPYDHDGEQVQTLKVLTASPLHDGASGPMLAALDLPIEHVGRETLTVEAGTFVTEHYRFLHEGDWPPQDAWCYGDDLILVRMDWEFTATRYELVELSPS
ncbi:MAG: hypothetical protein OXF41_09655 [bacterium]|nr:hypothetical protein [bacterium]